MIKSNLTIKLIDFGYGNILKDPFQKFKRYCGTPYYMPPEMIKKIYYDGKIKNFYNLKEEKLMFGHLEFYILNY